MRALLSREAAFVEDEDAVGVWMGAEADGKTRRGAGPLAAVESVRRIWQLGLGYRRWRKWGPRRG